MRPDNKNEENKTFTVMDYLSRASLFKLISYYI